jgi:carbon storage regulator
MLVLSRRHGEEILVGDNVVIKVLAVAHGRVQVGIEAPREVPIRRSELTPQEVGVDIRPERSRRWSSDRRQLTAASH